MKTLLYGALLCWNVFLLNFSQYCYDYVVPVAQSV
jgi:hypothetical protein